MFVTFVAIAKMIGSAGTLEFHHKFSKQSLNDYWACQVYVTQEVGVSQEVGVTGNCHVTGCKKRACHRKWVCPM